MMIATKICSKAGTRFQGGYAAVGATTITDTEKHGSQRVGKALTKLHKYYKRASVTKLQIQYVIEVVWAVTYQMILLLLKLR